MDCNGGSSIQHAWQKDLPYKVAERSFIARVMYNPLSIVVPASSPWKTTATVPGNPAGTCSGR